MQNLLSGMRIVEGSAFIAAPSGGMTLAQLGADVIRFDPIGGGIDYKRWPVTNEGHSLYWHSLNKGKRSIAVNFRTPQGQELLSQLITAPGENTGMFSTNFPAKGWLAEEKLRARRADLIYLNLTGDRHGGSALDYTVNCKVGLPYLNSFEDNGKPLNNPLAAWDVLAGQHIAIGLLAAERHRRLTGAGQFIKLALEDVALATMGHLGYVAEAAINEAPRQAAGNHIFGTFGHDFQCQGGERIMIVGVSPNQWQGIVNATGIENEVQALAVKLGLDFSQEGDRYQAREQLRHLIQPWFEAKSFDQAKAELDYHKVCWGPYQSMQQMLSNDIADNPLFETVDQPNIGPYPMSGNPLYFGAASREPVQPAPRLGQHTDEILADTLHMSGSEIARLHDQDIVAGSEQ